MSEDSAQHIAAIHLDDSSIMRRTSELEHERQVAMQDLIEWNYFSLPHAQGPYTVTLKAAENRITMMIAAPSLAEPCTVPIPLAPLRSVIRDYFMICESYFEAVRAGNLPRIEAIDMSRRGLHNEGADILTSQLEGKVETDSETARRLFTLISVLHMK